MPDLTQSEPLPNDELLKEIDSQTARPEVHGANSKTPQLGPQNLNQRLEGSSIEARSPGSNQNPGRAVSRRQSSGLIRDDSGHAHFIGPSGTLSFFADLRQLISSREKKSGETTADSRSPFTNDDTAKALEANDIHHESNEQDEAGVTNGPSPQSILSDLSKEFSGPVRPDPSHYLKILPPQDTINDLCHVYFTKIHSDFPLFHRATFEDELEAFVVQRRSKVLPHARKAHETTLTTYGPDFGWLASLYMILLLGSAVQSSSNVGYDVVAMRRTCLTEARSLLPQLVSRCTMTNVQALLLHSLFLHNNNHRNGAWNLLGTATRISFALGLHRQDLDTSFRPIERELRKRVFCTLYGFEQFLSSSLGRPSGLNEFDVEIKAPRDGFLDDGAGTSSDFTTARLKLQKVLGQTRAAIAKLKEKLSADDETSISWDSAHAPDEEVLDMLESWKKDLPFHLRVPSIGSLDGLALPKPASHDTTGDMSLHSFGTLLSRQTPEQLRALVKLHIQYHYIALLVTRPTLLWEVSSTSSRDPSHGASQQAVHEVTHDGSVHMSEHPSSISETCQYHAAQLAALIVLLDRFRLLNGVSALDVFYAYSAGLVLILGLLRPQKQDSCSDVRAREQSSPSHESKVLISILRSTIRKLPKCPTMKRMAGVMDKFASSIIQEDQPGGLEHNADVALGHISAEEDLQGQQHGITARHAGAPLDQKQSGGVLRDGDERARLSGIIEERSTHMGSFWPSPGESTHAGGAHNHGNLIPAGPGGLHASHQQLGYTQHHSHMNTSGNGQLFDFGQHRQMSHMHYASHPAGHTAAAGGGGGAGGGSSFHHMQLSYHYAHNSSDASLSLEPFRSDAPGMQSEHALFSGLQGQQQMQQHSFWHDPFGRLVDGHILDWADLETFLAT
ncbi:hypothetical protein PV08_07305 [Exophiala spinifera]|uniref:Xylanolytic transcriptional activator regulatory domain-containing protein n=1 Tax=Exophiala spinifera TaxID=91928 RepID=A0A0D1YI01_9EURO|nr:uncharacterized protein PV08_07305 [Exophiala spinifera]KIW14521.1 hypothetical protein PV08_07305 [Exophiala spinifera]